MVLEGHPEFTEQMQGRVMASGALHFNMRPAVKEAIDTILKNWQQPDKTTGPVDATIKEFFAAAIKAVSIPESYNTQVEKRAFNTVVEQYKHDQLTDVDLQKFFSEQIEDAVKAQLCTCYAASDKFTTHIDNQVMGKIVSDWKLNCDEETLSENLRVYLTDLFTSKLREIQQDINELTSISRLASEVKALREENTELVQMISKMTEAIQGLYKIHNKPVPSFAREHGVVSRKRKT